MRALLCRELGGIDSLELGELPLAEPSSGEVLIKVSAAGLNFADLLMIKGQYQEKPDLPFAPGMEIAGRIERLGSDVNGFQIGQRVMATVSHGGFAEAAIAQASEVVPLPNEVDDVTAAGFAIAYGTAFGALQWATTSGSRQCWRRGPRDRGMRQGIGRHRHRHCSGSGTFGGRQGAWRRSCDRYRQRGSSIPDQGVDRWTRR